MAVATGLEGLVGTRWFGTQTGLSRVHSELQSSAWTAQTVAVPTGLECLHGTA